MFGSDGPFYIGAYIGVIALVLALVGIGGRRRRPVIIRVCGRRSPQLCRCVRSFRDLGTGRSSVCRISWMDAG